MKIGVDKFNVEFVLPNNKIKVFENLSLTFEENKIIGIIGESGSGKSVLGMAILGILPNYAKVSGEIIFEDRKLKYKSEEHLKLLGDELGFIPQNPQDSLNPARKIKKQIYEILAKKYKGKEKEEKALELLFSMGFEKPKEILDFYPHELSGGMQQRVLSAISIALHPKWIIADEPTKGLDKELCVQVSETFKNLKKIGTKSIIVITHDINLAKIICDDIYVMYKGKIIDKGRYILEKPEHIYTKALIDAMPENKLEPIEIPEYN